MYFALLQLKLDTQLPFTLLRLQPVVDYKSFFYFGTLLMTLRTYFLILLASLMGAIGAVFLKNGANVLVFDRGLFTALTSGLLNARIVVGLVFYLVPSAIFIYLLRLHELSKLQPLVAITYVITPILSMIFLRESVDLMRWIGIAFIVTGITLVSQS